MKKILTILIIFTFCIVSYTKAQNTDYSERWKKITKEAVGALSFAKNQSSGKKEEIKKLFSSLDLQVSTHDTSFAGRKIIVLLRIKVLESVEKLVAENQKIVDGFSSIVNQSDSLLKFTPLKSEDNWLAEYEKLKQQIEPYLQTLKEDIIWAKQQNTDKY